MKRGKFKLKNSISAVCSPIKTLPEVWILNACARIDMNCSDPTQTDSTNLWYYVNLIGSSMQAFTVDDLSNGVYNLCYNLTESGRYELSVIVWNDLLDNIIHITLDIDYTDTTPQFINSSYSVEIPENIPVGSNVISILASVDYGDLSYSIQVQYLSITGQESLPVFEITTTGVIQTTLSLRPYTDQTMRLKVKAMNEKTKLTAITDVIVYILDVDDPPSCEAFIVPLLTVDSPVGAVVGRFTCIDSDIIQKYIRDLKIFIQMSLDNKKIKDDAYFDIKIVSKGNMTTGSLLTKTLLPVNIPMYNITVIVRENISTQSPRYSDIIGRQPVYQEHFVVNVNLTPPVPSFDVFILNPIEIQVRWGFTRLEFYTITEWYIIRWNENEINGSVNRFREIQQNTLTVEEDKVYRVQVKVKTKYGLLVTPVKTVKTPVFPIYSPFIASFQLKDRAFVPELYNKSSREYIELSQFVKSNLESELYKTPGFVVADLLQFRNGSVSVDILITVNQTGSVLENSAVLKSAIESGYLGQLAVEPWSYSITEGDGKLQVGLTVNGQFYEDAALTFTCTADIIGNVGQTAVTWTLNNVVLRPTSKSRWKIKRLQPSRLIPFRVVYQLSVNPLKVRDSGRLSCSVTDGYNLQSNRTIQMKVLGKPIVFIGPMSAGIMQGETIPVECFILSNPSEVQEIKWFKNGNLFNGSKDEVIRKGPEGTSEILTNRNIQRNVIYECLGKNEAGEGPKVMSNITAYLYQDEKSRILCYINTDRFGTVWNWTIAGITVIKPCKGNQRGEVSRVCNKKGVWRIPDYSSCVRKEFVSIVEEAEHLKDGVEKEVVDDILKKLTNLTKQKDVQLTSGDLTAASNTLLSVADHAKERLETVSSDQLEEFLVSANNILGDENKEDWRQLKTKQKINVTTVLKAVQNYNDAYSQSETKPFKKRIQNDNIVVEIGKVQNEDISFPDRSQSQPSWITKSKTTIKLQQSSLKKNQLVGYNTAYYRNISDLFPTSVLINSESKDVKGNIQVNSDVVNFGTYPPLPHIDPPLVITFEYLSVSINV
ncbi:unnamed protein product [Mytilus edulis]|uniref:Uncharacterized protein n=1 Tax=Mytilus edulis TaxID=6550 RepID=A0A8S3U712_MYTED|nr:unnamed protein product [Mytilus edulis]